MPSTSDKTAARVASTLIFLEAAIVYNLQWLLLWFFWSISDQLLLTLLLLASLRIKEAAWLWNLFLFLLGRRTPNCVVIPVLRVVVVSYSTHSWEAPVRQPDLCPLLNSQDKNQPSHVLRQQSRLSSLLCPLPIPPMKDHYGRAQMSLTLVGRARR